jgi:hypothetical protein
LAARPPGRWAANFTPLGRQAANFTPPGRQAARPPTSHISIKVFLAGICLLSDYFPLFYSPLKKTFSSKCYFSTEMPCAHYSPEP